MQGVSGTTALRLRAAFELFDLAEAMLRQSVRRENPDASPGEVERRIMVWRRRRPEWGEPDGSLRIRRDP
jgi:hypothetical protein